MPFVIHQCAEERDCKRMFEAGFSVSSGSAKRKGLTTGIPDDQISIAGGLVVAPSPQLDRVFEVVS